MTQEGTTTVCTGCGEDFATEFDNDSEEWMFKAVDSKAGPMHPHCFGEAELVSVATRVAVRWLLKQGKNKKTGVLAVSQGITSYCLAMMAVPVCVCRAAHCSHQPAQLTRRSRLLLKVNLKQNVSKLERTHWSMKVLEPLADYQFC